MSRPEGGDGRPDLKMADEGDVKTGDLRLKASKNVTVAFKLNGRNYALWARLMRVAIGSRRALRHITGVLEPPKPTDKEYLEWEETDLVVFSWIVDNMEIEIVADFAHHQSAKAIWDSLAVTYQSTSDSYMIYDLEDKASRIVQGDTDLETYWRTLHGVWIEIDRCQTKTITCCDKGIGEYRNIINQRRLYKFLAGLNAQFEGTRRDILKESPTPPVDVAYGWVKREAIRLKIMPPASPYSTTGANGVGLGFGARNTRFQTQQTPPPLIRPGQPPTATNGRRGATKPDKTKLWCSNCGMNKHTRENCFKLIGFPEWWDENQKGKARLAISVEETGGTESAARGRGADGVTPRGGDGKRAEEVGKAAFA